MSEKERENIRKVVKNLSSVDLKEHYKDVLEELQIREFPTPSQDVLRLIEADRLILAVTRYMRDNPTISRQGAQEVIDRYRK